MADSLVATAGAANADSYNTLAALATHFSSFGAPEGWDDLSDDEKCRYARVATLWMDRRWAWRGLVADVTTPQALAWPRSGVVDADGRTISSTAIPAAIARLHAEATKLAAEGKLQVGALERGGQVVSETVDVISTTFLPGAPAESSYPFLDAIARPLVAGTGFSFLNG